MGFHIRQLFIHNRLKRRHGYIRFDQTQAENHVQGGFVVVPGFRGFLSELVVEIFLADRRGYLVRKPDINAIAEIFPRAFVVFGQGAFGFCFLQHFRQSKRTAFVRDALYLRMAFRISSDIFTGIPVSFRFVRHTINAKK